MLSQIYRNTLIILLLILGFSPLVAKDEQGKKFTIVIDAGHGGKDIGATDNGVKEKDINLKVAKYLESLIKKRLKNSKTVMTRDDDRYLTLQERADIANQSQGDIFVSIHTNSVDRKNRNRKNIAGSSVYTLGLNKEENNLEVAMRENSVIELEQDFEQKYSGFDPMRDESYIIFEMAQKNSMAQSIKLANEIEKELVSSGRQDRGVHQAGFWVLWATSMPSVLVELDFICNPESAKYLSSDKGAKELAEAIFKAIQQYEKSWRKSLIVNSADTGLQETYVEESTGSNADTYAEIVSGPVVKARTRSHSAATPGKKIMSPRKRRSSASRELSLQTSYEKDNIEFSFPHTYAVATVSETFVEENPATPNEENSKKKNKKTKSKNKEPKTKAPKKAKKDSHNGKVNKLITVYKIQILASSDLLNQGSDRFCGLSPITAYKENNIYKYYYGESTDKSELEAMLADVKKKIPDAFIVTSQKSVQVEK